MENLIQKKLKTDTKILTAKTDHFRVNLDSIDNDFNKWSEEKELNKEFNNNSLSEWQQKRGKILINNYRKLGEIISKEK